jgi:hypothetical protein
MSRAPARGRAASYQGGVEFSPSLVRDRLDRNGGSLLVEVSAARRDGFERVVELVDQWYSGGDVEPP